MRLFPILILAASFCTIAQAQNLSQPDVITVSLNALIQVPENFEQKRFANTSGVGIYGADGQLDYMQALDAAKVPATVVCVQNGYTKVFSVDVNKPSASYRVYPHETPTAYYFVANADKTTLEFKEIELPTISGFNNPVSVILTKIWAYDKPFYQTDAVPAYVLTEVKCAK